MTEIANPVPAAAAAARPAPAVKLAARGLGFSYGDTRALTGIDIDVHERCVTALIGPSGCGKSTLLRVFNRIYALYPGQRADGQVLLDGEDILSPKYPLARLRSKVGMVFQKPVPFPMSIHENVAYAIRHHERLSRGQLDERVEEALRPEVLLLDEPTSALDPIATGKIEQLVADLKSRYTILMVTHNMHQAARCSDYTAFMYLGELVEFGSTERMFTNPGKRQTEDYVTGRFG